MQLIQVFKKKNLRFSNVLINVKYQISVKRKILPPKTIIPDFNRRQPDVKLIKDV